MSDYIFDRDGSNGEVDHDQGDDLLIRDEIFIWMRPQRLIKTQCSYDRVLDFTFIAGEAEPWRASCKILAAHETSCPDDNRRSDHRPVRAMFQLPTDGEPNSRQPLLSRLQRIEVELRALKILVKPMSE